MKKLFILGIALSLFISCAKEDNAGIPPVNQGQTPQQKDLSIPSISKPIAVANLGEERSEGVLLAKCSLG